MLTSYPTTHTFTKHVTHNDKVNFASINFILLLLCYYEDKLLDFISALQCCMINNENWLHSHTHVKMVNTECFLSMWILETFCFARYKHCLFHFSLEVAVHRQFTVTDGMIQDMKLPTNKSLYQITSKTCVNYGGISVIPDVDNPSTRLLTNLLQVILTHTRARTHADAHTQYMKITILVTLIPHQRYE
jgi:hypothetical protein